MTNIRGVGGGKVSKQRICMSHKMDNALLNNRDVIALLGGHRKEARGVRVGAEDGGFRDWGLERDEIS